MLTTTLTGPPTSVNLPRRRRERADDDSCSVTSNDSRISLTGSECMLTPGCDGGFSSIGPVGNHNNWQKRKLQKQRAKAIRKLILQIFNSPNWLHALGLPPLTPQNLKAWTAAHVQSPDVLAKVQELTEKVFAAIDKSIKIEAYRVPGSTSRNTVENSKIDVDLAVLCPSSANVKSIQQLLGPMSRDVTWRREKASLHRAPDGTVTRRIFAELVLKGYPHLPMDIAVFQSKTAFDTQGEVLNELRRHQHAYPLSRQLTTVMKGFLRQYGHHAKEHYELRATAPGIAIEMAALHTAKRFPGATEVTPEILQCGLKNFGTPSAGTRQDWAHEAYDFNIRSPAFAELRYGAQVLARAMQKKEVLQ